MRQFIYATGVGAGNGQVRLVNIDSVTGNYVAASNANVKTNPGLAIQFSRTENDGGNVILPLGRKDVSWVKGTYAAPTLFTVDIDLLEAAIEEGLDYTVILVKKGIGFNERNKWTATFRALHNDDHHSIAKKLCKYFSDNASSIGINVIDNEDGTFTIEGAERGVDFTVKFADALSGVTADETHATVGYGTPSQVSDLANKAAADAGFEYTFQDMVNALYPKYPFEKTVTDFAQNCDILTIRCAEPRDVKTRDELVHQIVQIAVPTGTAVSGITDVLDDLI